MEKYINYKHKITGQEVLVRKIPKILTHPKVFYEVRFENKVGYINLSDFKKNYEKINLI